MKSNLFFGVKYILYWFIYFISLKVLLLSYHASMYSSFTGQELLNVFLFGMKLDISFIGYILLLPLLLLFLSPWIKETNFKTALKFYTYFVVGIISFLAIIDLEIFKWWGFRVDSTVFRYLQVPAEIMATASVAPVGKLLLCFAIIFGSFFFLYHYIFKDSKLYLPKNKIITPVVALLLIGSLAIPIRGGLQQIPVRQSSVYFSNSNLLNQASLNLAWNFFKSLSADKYYKAEKPYTFKELDKPEILLAPYLATTKNDSSGQFINNPKPNVLIIIWESFTYKAITDARNITPEFNKLKKQGLFFDNIYASGDRSDKGLISILSGYPAQPTYSISRNPVKSAKLPCLANIFLKNGYETSFYYGGEPDFANLKSYFLTGGFQNIIQKSDFPTNLQTSKWGVHDEYVFDKLSKDLKNTQKPFFKTLFTLSSHEPYDVPLSYIKGKSNEEQFCNSMYYADKCLSNFLNKSKQEPWWKNTLVIIIADHGHTFPGKNQWATHDASEFHIPMLWTGGALKNAGIESKIGSQTDLAATLLNQLNINSEEFIYSKNLFHANSPQFAYYAFNNGFGVIQEDKLYAFENVGNKILHQQGVITDNDLKLGKAYLQYSFRDYSQK